MTAQDDYPELWTLIGGMLHQDWTIESGTVQRAMFRGLDGSNVDNIVIEIDRLLSTRNENAVLDELGCEVYFPYYDVSGREFLIWLKVFARFVQRERAKAQHDVRTDGM